MMSKKGARVSERPRRTGAELGIVVYPKRKRDEDFEKDEVCWSLAVEGRRVAPLP